MATTTMPPSSSADSWCSARPSGTGSQGALKKSQPTKPLEKQTKTARRCVGPLVTWPARLLKSLLYLIKTRLNPLQLAAARLARPEWLQRPFGDLCACSRARHQEILLRDNGIQAATTGLKALTELHNKRCQGCNMVSGEGLSDPIYHRSSARWFAAGKPCCW